MQSDENDLKNEQQTMSFFYTPPHRVVIMRKYIVRHSVTTLVHPPYSPEQASANFYLFPRLKVKLKEHRLKG